MSLLEIFSEVIEVESNPYHLIIEEVFKIDGQIKREKREEIYNLIPYKEFDKDLISYISDSIIPTKIKSNFFSRIFSNPFKNIKVDYDDIIISNKKNIDKIKAETKIVFDTNEIIIAKKSRILINKKEKQFYINLNDFEIYDIN
jgi:hypothetical protein